jgi:hypothetical protein
MTAPHDADIRARLARRPTTISAADLEKFTAFTVQIVAPVIADFLREQREQIDHLKREIVLQRATERARRARELVQATESDADD